MAYRNRYLTKEFVQTTPAAAVITLWRAPVACKVLAVRASRTGGTGAVVKAWKNATALTSADKSLTSADTFMAASLSTTAATLRFAAGDTLKVEVVSVAGTPTQLTLQVDFALDANSA